MNPKFTLSFLLLFAIVSTTSAQNSYVCDPCDIDITDNEITHIAQEITVAGTNDLSVNPLVQFCIAIEHPWVGDLSLSLTSPGGLHYLLMADDDNGFGGCGTNADDIDICITTGTNNPLTNNTPYICNGGEPCLQGNWTLPCGGVTDPVAGAVQAPGCDLAYF